MRILFASIIILCFAMPAFAVDMDQLYESSDRQTKQVITRVRDAGLVLHPAEHWEQYGENTKH